MITSKLVRLCAPPSTTPVRPILAAAPRQVYCPFCLSFIPYPTPSGPLPAITAVFFCMTWGLVQAIEP